MGLPNKEELEGKWDQAKGSVKETIGNATGNRDLEEEGQRDKAQGQVNEKVGEVRRKVGETVEDIGKSIGR
jgi:uncharacterized protein YjbJ (UPF0337 family)